MTKNLGKLLLVMAVFGAMIFIAAKECGAVTLPQCSDGIDNDQDGRIDLLDAGCVDPQDNDETNPTMYLPQMPVCNGSFGAMTQPASNFFYGWHYDEVPEHYKMEALPGPDGLTTNTQYGNSLDWYWVLTWDWGYAGSPAYLDWDMGKQVNKLRVYPSQDHGPYPEEFNEYNVQVSSDQVNWWAPTQTALYVDDYSNVRVHDGVKDYFSTSSFGYARITPTNGDFEIDAVRECGMTEPVPQCSDGLDNDQDGLVDMQDPGCADPQDNDETNQTPPANQAPVITLLGQSPMSVFLNATFTDPGATSTDPEDGDLTSKIKVLGAINTSATGTYPLVYSVHDSGGLGATSTRQVFVVEQQSAQCSDGLDNDGDGKIDSQDISCHTDKNPNNPDSYVPTQDTENLVPVITLNGSDNMTLSYGSAFSDPGAVAADFEDGNITSQIVIGGKAVNTSDAGSYTITYDVKDSQNVLAQQKTRQVMVQEQSHGSGGGSGGGGYISVQSTPALQITDEKVVYLGNGKAEVTWKTNLVATSLVVYGTTSKAMTNAAWENYGYPLTTVEVKDMLASHTMLITGLQDGIPYYFRPVSTNSSSQKVLGKEVFYGVTTTAPVAQPVVQPPVNQPTTCNYLLEYLKIGQANNPVEVKKLQNFLNQFEGDGLAVNGFFTQETFDAVSDFQMKYLDDVLTPWGYLEPTGYVYITTKKKVNELYCNRTFPLNGEQIAEIDAFRTMYLQMPESVSTSTIGKAPTAGRIAGGQIGSQGTITEPEKGLTIDKSGLLANVEQPTGQTAQQEPGQEAASPQEEQELGILTIAGLGGVVQSKLIYLLALILAVLVFISVIFFFRAKRRQEVPYSIPPFPENIPTA